MSLPRPRLVTFDVFGTILDWRRGTPDAGLTTVYVERPHRRPGPADVVVPDLAALADLVERESAGERSGR